MKNIKAWGLVGRPEMLIVQNAVDGNLCALTREIALGCEDAVYQIANSEDGYAGSYNWLDAGEYLGEFTTEGFVPFKKREETKMKSENFQTLYDALTPGDKVHMANKLFKDDGIIAQKVRTYIADNGLNIPQPPKKLLDVGTIVIVESAEDEELLNPGPAFIVKVDASDDYYPYQIQQGDLKFWMSEKALRAAEVK